MIRSSGRIGVIRALGVLLWMLRYDLLAVVVVAALMAALSDKIAFGNAATIVPLLGVVVSIFIGFRNSNAYSRWWEARTLWGTVVGNCRAISNALIAVDDGSDDMATVVDRMRRRQVRHAWQLAAELRRVAPVAGVAELTSEDPATASASALLSLQAAEVRDLVHADRIDRQGRVILTNLNTAQAMAAGGLERIRHQAIPLPYAMFVRSVAWFFGILVCTRLDTAGHDNVLGIMVGVLIMTLFIMAERLGHFIEEPMSNTPFDLPMNRFCAGITADILGPGHPLARPRDREDAVIWM
jgi:putative membrane protein